MKKLISKIKFVFEQFRSAVNEVNKISNKRKSILYIDIFICALLYGASPNNYLHFQFYKLPHRLRKTYTTNAISEKLIKKYNNPEFEHIFENKLIFAETFSDMFMRGFLNAETMTKKEFIDFCSKKDKIILKPYGGSQGQNIVVYHIDDNANMIFDEIKRKYPKGYMIEEWIKQHPVLSEIFPNAVNCLRIISIYDNEKVDLITGGVTFSLGAEIANGSQPSIVAPVDFSTGILHKGGASFDTPVYDRHPVTNAQILGVQLPYWKETVDLITKATKKIPGIRYIGWDIAITPDGPVLIEGNTTPGYIYYQIPSHLEDHKGNRYKYTQHL